MSFPPPAGGFPPSPAGGFTPPPGAPPPPPGGPLAGVIETVNSNYISVAVLVAILWDIATTYDEEVRYVYNKKVSTAKILWFANRILLPVNVAVHTWTRLLANPSAELCTRSSQFSEWMTAVNLFVIQAALCLRVIALYGRDKRVIAFLTVLLVGATASRIAVVALFPTPFIVVRFPTINVQYPGACQELPPPVGAYAFVGSLILDVVLFIMTVGRAIVQFLKPQKTFRTPLLVQLYKDGTIYFLIVAVTLALTITGFFEIPLVGPITSSFLYLGIVSVTASHMMLNLRRVADEQRLGGSNWNFLDVGHTSKNTMGSFAQEPNWMELRTLQSPKWIQPQSPSRWPRPPRPPSFTSFGIKHVV